MEYLEALEAEFNKLSKMLKDLEDTYNTKTAEMAMYKAALDDLQKKIDRGDKLVSGLSGEKTRWEATIIDLDEQYEKMIGDCALAAAFMSYCGPFPSEFRNDLISNWTALIQSENVPHTAGFDFSGFMAGPAKAR